MEIGVDKLFDLSKTIAAGVFSGVRYPWEILEGLRKFILKLGPMLPEDMFYCAGEGIWIARDAHIASSACLNGPMIIDSDAEIRHGAFIRGSVVVGKKTVVGNSTELKNCLLCDCVQVPHFNYVGDSVLGAHAHLGAGVITSNVRGDRRDVVIHAEQDYHTGLRKLGALIGERAEVGCNSVLNPGTVLGRDCMVYPSSCVRGWVPEKCIFKTNGRIVPKREA